MCQNPSWILPPHTIHNRNRNTNHATNHTTNPSRNHPFGHHLHHSPHLSPNHPPNEPKPTGLKTTTPGFSDQAASPKPNHPIHLHPPIHTTTTTTSVQRDMRHHLQAAGGEPIKVPHHIRHVHHQKIVNHTNNNLIVNLTNHD